MCGVVESPCPSPKRWLVWVLLGEGALPGWPLPAGRSESASVFPASAGREANSSAKFYYDSERNDSVFVWRREGEGVISLLSDRFHLPNIRSDHE